ncbi:MAG: heme/copper-type cytochrome/quinol oxidase subunit 3 [Arenicella sp.]|jgi:heme/copper-type cytochrome/quinol oxidase subunit 3
MKNINQTILEALQDDKAAHEFSEEQANALQLIGQSFKGTFRLTFVVVVSLQLIFAGLAIYCAYHLVNELDIGLKINWLAGTLSTVVAFAIARIWFFMELNRLSVIREVKRVELQISLLAESYQK